MASQKQQLIGFTFLGIALGAGALALVMLGGSAAPKFRRVRFFNASNVKVNKIQIKDRHQNGAPVVLEVGTATNPTKVNSADADKNAKETKKLTALIHVQTAQGNKVVTVPITDQGKAIGGLTLMLENGSNAMKFNVTWVAHVANDVGDKLAPMPGAAGKREPDLPAQ